MNRFQTVGFALITSVLSVGQVSAFYRDDMSRIPGMRWDESGQSAEVTIQNLISNFMIFLGLIAVCYALYGGFKILTAGGGEDDNKVSKRKKILEGKKILVQAGIALVAIFLARFLAGFALGAFLVGA